MCSLEHPVISANYSDPAFAPWQLWLDSCVKLAIEHERARQRALLTELIVLLREQWRSEIERELRQEAPDSPWQGRCDSHRPAGLLDAKDNSGGREQLIS
jgi:hypothetical protein